jgi:putative thioredoxin
MSDAAWILDVEQADFEREVIERSHERPVVVDFWAEWCAPCRVLGPVLERLAQEGQGKFLLVKVNVDRAPELAIRYGIQGIPAVKAFRDGKVVLEFVGLLPEAKVRQFLERLLPGEAEQLAIQAAGLESTDPSAAEAAYRRALELEPQQAGASVGLARLLLGRGEDAEARRQLESAGAAGDLAAEVARLEAILHLRQAGESAGDASELRRRVEADPESALARFELGRALAAAGRYPEALEVLISAAERDKKLAAEKVRELMVKLFYAIGVRSPMADEYRSRLSSLLY